LHEATAGFLFPNDNPKGPENSEFSVPLWCHFGR
jgi:hypothetical protein